MLRSNPIAIPIEYKLRFASVLALGLINRPTMKMTIVIDVITKPRIFKENPAHRIQLNASNAVIGKIETNKERKILSRFFI
jgi:hypothetical protein